MLDIECYLKKELKDILTPLLNLKKMLGIKFRLVVIHTNDGDLEYITDIFDIPPYQIKFCYDARWDMEVFNKELKSNLKINHLVSEKSQRCFNSNLLHTYHISPDRTCSE